MVLFSLASTATAPSAAANTATAAAAAAPSSLSCTSIDSPVVGYLLTSNQKYCYELNLLLEVQQ